MINEFLTDTVIWTDHSVTIQIMRQMVLISFSMNKLNLHLVKALQYCFQFCINVQHCSDQLNTVLNMLSCILNKIMNSKNQLLENILENIDEKIHIYHITVIEISSDFQNKIKKVYLKNKKWKKIIQQLHCLKESLTDMSSYFYFINENLVYYLDFIDTWQWFCVSKILEKKIFKITHDDHYHVSFHWIYNSIIADLYIWNLSWCLKQYITHCLKCLYYQITRHMSYKALQSIVESLISFHIITADFIFKLSKISSDLNAVIIIICKFFKKMKFIFDKEIWTITEWAKIYFAYITD